MVDVSEQEPEHGKQHPGHPERARLYAPGRRIDNGAACMLLVIQRDDGWSIHDPDLPGEGVYVPNDSMFLLAKLIVSRSRQ